MKKHKKVIFETLFFIGIFLLTLYSVFFGEDLGAIADGLGRCNKAWLSPAILCVVIFICGEAVIIWHLMKTYEILHSVFISWIFLQLCNAVSQWRTAYAGIFYEKKKYSHTGGIGGPYGSDHRI